jgi:hypothetical protein
MSETAVWPRLLAAIGALALGAVAVVIVVVLGHRTPGPAAASSAPEPPVAEPSGTNAGGAFPAPPPGTVVFGRRDGSDILALAVLPVRRPVLQASVVDQQGQGVNGLRVSFRLGSDVVVGAPCGAGCYRAVAPSAGAPKSVVVEVARDNATTTWPVTMPRPWPPPDAASIVAEATRTYKSLRSLVIHDRLASDETHAVETRWKIVAPDKLAYKIVNGPAAVVVGDRRWDKVPGGTWQQSNQTPIEQPTPFWSSWNDAHVLSQTKDHWRVSFYAPTTPGWFELVIQKRSMRPLDMRMAATAHFMHQVFSSFNEPLRVRPPAR